MFLFGEIAALITAMLWAGSSIIFTEASRRIGSQQINIDRMIAASFFLLLTLLAAGLIHPINHNQAMYLILSGIIGLIIGDGFLFKAFQIIGARYSMLIMSLVPAFSAILAFVILNERISLTVILGMIITLGGIVFVVSEGSHSHQSREKPTKFGMFAALIGALGQAAAILLAKAAFGYGEINGFLAAFIRIFSSAVIFLPAMIILKRYKSPFSLYRHDFKSLGLTIAGSLVGPYFGITFSLIAIKNTDVAVASTLMATVPVLMLPLVRVVYKEKITLRSVIGSIVAVIGVAILFLR